MAIGTDYRNLTTTTGKTKLINSNELIKRELEMLFNFDKYSLFFGNEIGINLNKYSHLTNRTATFNLIKTDIETALRKYGKVIPISINMKFIEDTNSIKIDLVVASVANRNVPITVPITVSN